MCLVEKIVLLPFFIMKKLKGYIDRLKKATPDVQQEALKKILDDNKSFMVGLIQDQLMAGYDAEGQQLEPYQSEEYAAFKRTLNPRGVTDLKLTGRFHRSIFADTSGSLVKFGATDSKTPELLAKYGNILNLTEESKELLVTLRFGPAAIRWYKKLYSFR